MEEIEAQPPAHGPPPAQERPEASNGTPVARAARRRAPLDASVPLTDGPLVDRPLADAPPAAAPLADAPLPPAETHAPDAAAEEEDAFCELLADAYLRTDVYGII